MNGIFFLHECLGLLVDMLHSVKTTKQSTEWKVRILLTFLKFEMNISRRSMWIYFKTEDELFEV